MKNDTDTKDKKICKCGCGKSFYPTRNWQVFYPGHRDKYWRLVYTEKRNVAERLSKIEEKLGL